MFSCSSLLGHLIRYITAAAAESKNFSNFSTKLCPYLAKTWILLTLVKERVFDGAKQSSCYKCVCAWVWVRGGVRCERDERVCVYSLALEKKCTCL